MVISHLLQNIFQTDYVSPAAPYLSIITFKGAGPNFHNDVGKLDLCSGRKLGIWSSEC